MCKPAKFEQVVTETIANPGNTKPIRPKKALAWNLALTVVSSSLGIGTMGATLGYSSPALMSLQSNTSRIVIHPGSEEESWFVSLIVIGMIIDAIFAGFLIDLYGRRWAIIAANIPATIGWAMIIGAQNIWMLYVGRFLSGISLGVLQMAVQIYIAEISPAHLRGSLALMVQIAASVCNLLIFALGLRLDWVELAVAAILVPILQIVLMCFTPESPRWLLRHNQQESARKALCWLRGDDVSEEFDDMLISIVIAPKGESKFNALAALVNPWILKPFMIGIFLQINQQGSGYIVMRSYTSRIFQSAGSNLDPNVSSLIVAAVFCVFYFFPIFFIDRFGRRILLISTAVVVFVSLLGLGTYFKMVETLGQETVNANYSWVPLASLVVCMIAFGMGYAPIPMIMTSELNPYTTRSLATSAATLFGSLCSFTISRTYNPLTVLINTSGVFWLYSAVAAAGVVFVYCCVPETKGKSLEEIERFFKRDRERKTSLCTC